MSGVRSVELSLPIETTRRSICGILWGEVRFELRYMSTSYRPEAKTGKTSLNTHDSIKFSLDCKECSDEISLTRHIKNNMQLKGKKS